MTTTSAAESPIARWVIAGLSVVVFVLVGVILYGFPRAGSAGAPGALPTINALLNGTAAVLLTVGWIFVRRRNIAAHRACMLAAFGFSTLFMVTYVLHHAQVGSVPFRGTGMLRTLYFAILVPHVILAAPVVPMALFTIWRGWTNRVAAHRRIARYTLPIWLYVSVSGVVVYFMLYHLSPR